MPSCGSPAEVAGPEFDSSGRVVGVVLKSGEKVLGDAVIATDGAYSPIKRALKIDSGYNGYSAIAIRSEMHANRPDSDSLDIYLKLAFQGDQLPGYGWVFPMGGSRFNIGLGYVNSYQNWQAINATQFLGGVPAHAAARMGAAAHRGTQEEQERTSVASADGGSGVAASGAGGVLFAGTRWARANPLRAPGFQGTRIRFSRRRMRNRRPGTAGGRHQPTRSA